jgi:hypothetical protein
MGEDGFAKVDPTPCRDPRCVFQLMKPTIQPLHAGNGEQGSAARRRMPSSRSAEYIASTAGAEQDDDQPVRTGLDRAFVGSQNIRCMAIIQLLLGNMGMAGGGINALRGHANVQGITDFALYAQNLPGYMSAERCRIRLRTTYLAKRTPKPLRAGPDELPAELPEVVHTSLPRPGMAMPQPRKTTSPSTTSRSWAVRRMCCRSWTTCIRAR